MKLMVVFSDALFCGGDVCGIDVAADAVAVEFQAGECCSSAPDEWVEYGIVGFRESLYDFYEPVE